MTIYSILSIIYTVKSTPNDAELGAKVRETILGIKYKS